MTPLSWLDDGETEADEYVGCGGTFVAAASARAHAHMPRRRKSPSPWRASGGSGSRNPALRKVSYWAATRDGSADPAAAAAALIAAFFFHPPLARWSWGARGDRTPVESTWR